MLGVNRGENEGGSQIRRVVTPNRCEDIYLVSETQQHGENKLKGALNYNKHVNDTRVTSMPPLRAPTRENIMGSTQLMQISVLLMGLITHEGERV